MAFLLAQLIDFGFGRDQGIYASVAAVMDQGGAPYRDAWDFKPPGIYFIYLLAEPLRGFGVHAIRLVEAGALVALTAAFARLSKIYVHDWRAGILGAGLAIVGYVHLEFWHTAQPESFAAAVIAWALALAAESSAGRDLSPSSLKWFSSGVLFGFAGLLKPTIGLAAVPSLTFAVRRSRRSTAALLVGVLLIAGACMSFLWSRGALGSMFDALFSFAPHYTAVSLTAPGRTPLAIAGLTLWGWLGRFSPVNLVGLGLLLITPHDRSFRLGLLHIGSTVLVLLLGIAAQLKFFPYHFGTVLPLTALLAGWGFWGLWLRLRNTARGTIAFGLLLAAAACTYPTGDNLRDSFAARSRLRLMSWVYPSRRLDIRSRLYSVNAYGWRDNHDVEQWVQRHLAPDAPIFVWGFTPEIYWVTQRPNSTSYPYNIPQRAPWSSRRSRLQMMAELTYRPPAAIIVEHDDIGPQVTGTTLDSAQELLLFKELNAFIASRYHATYRLGRFDVYK